MCGIAGALDLTDRREFPPQLLLAMTGAIAHRGPDDEHIHIEPGLALGTRRLAIIDVAHGRQPIENESGDIWSAFNGELFDYPLIRQNLLARGHKLKTHCDSEAWVHLYEEHGESMFDHAYGQFAVAVWDRKQRLLILGRDRVGICPLYYTVRDGWLLWASEIKGLLASGLVPAKADPKGIDYLFNFYGPSTSRTFFADVKLLPPGNFLRVKDGQIKLCQYWDLDFPDAGEERRVVDTGVLVDELEVLLNKAIERRLRSDVPVVSYLSGGVDSSIVLGLSSRQRKQALPSFAIGMDKRTGPNESSHAAEVAQLFGSQLTTLPMDGVQIANAFPEFIIATEGPALDTSCAALMQLAAEIHRQGYKVALTGEGADEAFAGYIWFRTQKVSNWLWPAVPRLLRKFLQYYVYPGPRRGKLIPELAIKGIRPAQQEMYEALSNTREILYSDQMWASIEDYDAYTDIFRA